ncbi:MAG: DUF3343 domain-containing protein [Clostridia bacterium]|nr:DUF3343 domain-containing protein [Clostridia bacterium]
MALHEILDRAEIGNRIAPTPVSIRGDHGCGMCILVKDGEIEAARTCLAGNGVSPQAVVPLEDQLRSRRDRYC